ncbi:MAG: hypothetical protein HC899_27450 [Leptolyngbyaceae cyanobacterium SM1_4_3]|nr:hypothetical protein [Leptolyngbyaceae cyanobacterium SM1_4_3]NJN89615.1 hypothetical protein [Leptolyngbyaceae cyanobacterium SL_5_14]
MQFGPGFGATFLYYFTSTAILFTLVSSQALGVDMGSGIPQQVGLVGGLVAGLMGAYFNRTTTLSVTFKGKKAFLANLNTVLSQMGYQQKSEEDDLLVYERSALGRFLSGKVYVQIEPEKATIASRSLQLKRIQKQIQ